ncbi:MAG: AMP-binding protein [Candidatus Nanopelagicaceae bacterium]|nr:AMP-binding protein [Candidatus Nanopelagicaceae bacterium]
MDYAVKRKLRSIDPSWSTPQLLDALLLSLKGEGPALSTTDIAATEVDSRVALVVTTSGSTGNPKSVLLSKQSLLASTRATHKYLKATSGQRWSLLLPTNHIAGLNVLLRSIELGTTPVTVDSHADYTAIVPTQLHRALNGDTKLFNHLKGCTAVLVGGGPLDKELKHQAVVAGINVIATYGMTETCGGLIYDGQTLDGVQVAIHDGRIALKAPQIALGYLDSELPTEDGWFITNDLGQIVDGQVEVLGRVDDQIISGGEKISISAIESFLQHEFKSTEIVAFSKPDKEWGETLCIATTADLELSLLQSKLKEKFGAHASPKQLYKIAAIPYLGIGKPDRKKLANDHA